MKKQKHSDQRIIFLDRVSSEEFSEKIQRDYLRKYHTHLFCHQGNLQFTFNGERMKCKKDEFLFWFADSNLGELKCSKSFKASVLLVEKEFLDRNNPDLGWKIDSFLYTKDHPIKTLNIEDKKRILFNFNALYDRYKETEHRFYEEILNRRMQIFILEMWHTFANVYERHKRSLQSGNIYERFIQLVEDHCLTQREVQFYAEKLHITPKYLSHICKSNTGITASKWIQDYSRQRIELLLHNKNLNISEIAEKMQFTSPSFFTRYVKKVLGVTPKKYRENFL